MQMQPPPQVPVDPQLWHWFSTVDRDRSGRIDAAELKMALKTGGSEFNDDTTRLMIRMFDMNLSGCIDFNEFAALWKYIGDWKRCSDSYDKDRSGSINEQELRTALTSFGYNFSSAVYAVLLKKFNKGVSGIGFDGFI
eukprot:EC118895.1.p1 GENE.EC118895.1~~EC118895.1.p1  ORF type:complete len:138 (+),score=5.02 EC118895.1:79-492(+)